MKWGTFLYRYNKDHALSPVSVGILSALPTYSKQPVTAPIDVGLRREAKHHDRRYEGNHQGDGDWQQTHLTSPDQVVCSRCLVTGLYGEIFHFSCILDHLKYFGMIRASVADTAGHISDGLMMAVFPAASAEMRGPRESATG